MPRKNANTAAKPKAKRKGGRQSSKAEGLPKGKRPAEEEAVVSRATMIRHPGRGGRGR